MAQTAPYAMQSITLLQPQDTIAQRVPVTALTNYIKAVNEAVATKLASGPPPPPMGIALIVAIRPNGASNAWIGAVSDIPAATHDAIIAAARSVAPPVVTGGTVVLAIDASLNGGTAPGGGGDMPLPPEWKKGPGGVEVTALVDSIWKD
ncbi:MAG TPA: hypothetical protein VHZ29_02095 [Rhizomicrobium sp.]|nr:hypothetical protein [Rhizomicrobium sp.]